MTIDQYEKLGLPDVPGVYRFINAAGDSIYIGKATSLRDRVRSYFNDDVIVSRGRRIVDMVAQAETVTYEVTPSVLEALILEANLIKKYIPKYNAQQKDNKSYNFVVLTHELFPKVLTIRGRTLQIDFPKKILNTYLDPFQAAVHFVKRLRLFVKYFHIETLNVYPHMNKKVHIKNLVLLDR